MALLIIGDRATLSVQISPAREADPHCAISNQDDASAPSSAARFEVPRRPSPGRVGIEQVHFKQSQKCHPESGICDR